LTRNIINCNCQKGDDYEEKDVSNYRKSHNILAARGNHWRFVFESQRVSTSTFDAFSPRLGKRVFSV
jgi:hypothetical protein